MSTSVRGSTLAHPRAASVSVDEAHLTVTLVDGRAVSVPLDWFAWLARASEEDRRSFTIVGDGAGIWWDRLDDGLSVPLLLGVPEHL